MLRINVWDEAEAIDGSKWVERELDLPPDCRDAVLINRKLEEANIGAELASDEVPAWEITKATDTGDLLVIECRNLWTSIILVNYLVQDS